ncbi:MAG: transcriptional regulator BetI [Cohaesibacter sp.]|nr:transcriptional regulator BetI [Cohaesibacter sp.]MCV6601507.1 transcriptional regulator BetI [Cohaesibacter sp.]
MPKMGQAAARKRAFVEAAIASIHKKGIVALTMADVAREAGVSAGLIHHYLGSKDQLLHATMRHLLHELQQILKHRLSRAKNPHKRLEAIIESNFTSEQMRPEVVSAWLAFYVQAQRSDSLSHLLHIYSRRLQSNLTAGFAAHDMPLARARIAAESTAALIDGFWLKAVLVEGVMNHKHAVKVLKRHVAQQIEEASATGIA